MISFLEAMCDFYGDLLAPFAGLQHRHGASVMPWFLWILIGMLIGYAVGIVMAFWDQRRRIAHSHNSDFEQREDGSSSPTGGARSADMPQGLDGPPASNTESKGGA